MIKTASSNELWMDGLLAFALPLPLGSCSLGEKARLRPRKLPRLRSREEAPSERGDDTTLRATGDCREADRGLGQSKLNLSQQNARRESGLTV